MPFSRFLFWPKTFPVASNEMTPKARRGTQFRSWVASLFVHYFRRQRAFPKKRLFLLVFTV